MLLHAHISFTGWRTLGKAPILKHICLQNILGHMCLLQVFKSMIQLVHSFEN